MAETILYFVFVMISRFKKILAGCFLE
jgi:hypothetical protein